MIVAGVVYVTWSAQRMRNMIIVTKFYLHCHCNSYSFGHCFPHGYYCVQHILILRILFMMVTDAASTVIRSRG